MRITGIERLAAVLVGLEGAGLVVLVGWQVAALAGGDTDSVVSALALAVLTAVGAAAVLAFAAAIWRDQSWGRSGGIVVQLLLLAVAAGAATGEYAHPLTGLALAAPALVALAVLIGAVRTAGRRKDAAGPDAADSVEAE